MPDASPTPAPTPIPSSTGPGPGTTTLTPDLEAKALNVAAMLLARSITDLTPIILHNATATEAQARRTAELIAASKRYPAVPLPPEPVHAPAPEPTPLPPEPVPEPRTAGETPKEPPPEPTPLPPEPVPEPRTAGETPKEPPPEPTPLPAEPEGLPPHRRDEIPSMAIPSDEVGSLDRPQDHAPFDTVAKRFEDILKNQGPRDVRDNSPAAAAADAAAREVQAKKEQMTAAGVHEGQATIPVWLMGPAEVLAGLANFGAGGGKPSGQAVAKEATGIAGGLGSVGDLLSRQFLSVLGPLAVLGQIVMGFAPAFQLLGGAINVMASTILPLRMPVFVVLSVAMIQLSDLVWDVVIDCLDDWVDYIFDTLLPALQDLVDFIGNLKGTKEEVEETAGRTAKGAAAGAVIGSIVPGIGTLAGAGLGGLFGFMTSGPSDEEKAAREESKAGRPTLSRPDRSGGGKNTEVALKDVLQELRMSIGPKASFSAITDVGKNIQMAALNQSPFQAKVLDRMQKMLESLEASRNRRAAAKAPYSGSGAGDYENGTSSGMGGDYGAG